MNVSSDYFLLYHGLLEVIRDETSSLHTKMDRAAFIELASLFLATHRKNFNHFSSLAYFKELALKLTDKKIMRKEDLYTLQSNILFYLQKDLSFDDLVVLDHSFKFLYDSKVLFTQQYEKLHTLFNPELLQTSKAQVKDVTKETTLQFLEQKELFTKDIHLLKELSSSKHFLSELDVTLAYIQNQRFSIGITGVMNAGKSTLLNALMRQELLGSSVIPETANLTVIKYSATPSAIVHYWDTKEWENLRESAQTLPSMKKFIDETYQALGDTLNSFISFPAKQNSIEVSDLSSYTSAAKSDYKCNLVKYVELGVNLDFLSDGIDIVDTPGLDDPVVQREEITKEYMADCDLMIHLMNVSQSATLKDVEFIIDALLYQNVSALLIVITRADTVSHEQLLEVIQYTKQSIKEQLKAINQDSKIDFIFESLSFLSVSGYMALQHRTGKSHHAIQAGFPLEKTGILEVEAYLHQTLFGSNSQKNRLFIHGINTRLKKALTREIESLHYELALLSKSSKELEQTLSDFVSQKSSDTSYLSILKSDMVMQRKQLLEYTQSLDGFIQSSLRKLQSLIKNRLIDDVKYNLETEKKRLSQTHIKNILLTALKDGIIDIIRDYRYKCLLKMENIALHITHKYQNSQLDIHSFDDDVDVSGLFKETFTSHFLSTNYDQLVTLVYGLIQKAKLKHLDGLTHEIEMVLQDKISQLETSIAQKAHHLTQGLLDDFFKHLSQPLEVLQENLKAQESMIKTHINSSQLNDLEKEKQALQTHHMIKELETCLKGYE